MFWGIISSLAETAVSANEPMKRERAEGQAKALCILWTHRAVLGSKHQCPQSKWLATGDTSQGGEASLRLKQNLNVVSFRKLNMKKFCLRSFTVYLKKLKSDCSSQKGIAKTISYRSVKSFISLLYIPVDL